MLAKFMEYLKYRSAKSIIRLGKLVFDQPLKFSLVLTVINETRNTHIRTRSKGSHEELLWRDIQENSERAFSGLQSDPNEPPLKHVDQILHDLYSIQGPGAPNGGKLYQVASLLRNFFDHLNTSTNYSPLARLLNIHPGDSQEVISDKLLSFVEAKVPKFFYYFQDAVYRNSWASQLPSLKRYFE
jgi:hypothetical protein